MEVTHFLCNYVTNTGQRQLYVGSSCSREPIQDVGNSIHMYKYFCIVYNGETDNNVNFQVNNGNSINVSQS